MTPEQWKQLGEAISMIFGAQLATAFLVAVLLVVLVKTQKDH